MGRGREKGLGTPQRYLRGFYIVFLLAFRCSAHFPDTTVEIWILTCFRGITAFFAHLRKMLWTVFTDISFSAFLRYGAIIFTATLFFEGCPSLFPDTPVVVFSVFVPDRTPSLATRLGCRHGHRFFFISGQHN